MMGACLFIKNCFKRGRWFHFLDASNPKHRVHICFFSSRKLFSHRFHPIHPFDVFKWLAVLFFRMSLTPRTFQGNKTILSLLVRNLFPKLFYTDSTTFLFKKSCVLKNGVIPRFSLPPFPSREKYALLTCLIDYWICFIVEFFLPRHLYATCKSNQHQHQQKHSPIKTRPIELLFSRVCSIFIFSV